MGLIGQVIDQAAFELKAKLIEIPLRFPVLGDIISMSSDVRQMRDGAYQVFVDGFTGPARYELKRQGIKVLAYNNNGVIWVSPEDGPLADAVLEQY